MKLVSRNENVSLPKSGEGDKFLVLMDNSNHRNHKIVAIRDMRKKDWGGFLSTFSLEIASRGRRRPGRHRPPHSQPVLTICSTSESYPQYM